MSFFVQTNKFNCFIAGEGECELEIDFIFPYKLYPFIKNDVFEDCIKSLFLEVGKNSYMFNDSILDNEIDETFEELPIFTKLDIIWSILQLRVASIFKEDLKVNVVPNVAKLLISFNQSGIKRTIEFAPEPGEEDNLQLQDLL